MIYWYIFSSLKSLIYLKNQAKYSIIEYGENNRVYNKLWHKVTEFSNVVIIKIFTIVIAIIGLKNVFYIFKFIYSKIKFLYWRFVIIDLAILCLQKGKLCKKLIIKALL